jgi:hypothetical protein
MATVAELDARWEAQYQIVLALRRELTAAQAAVAQSAAYQNGTEAERVALGQVGAVEAARLAFNAENQKLTALKKELDAAVAAEAAEKEATTSPTTSAATDVANSAAGATQNPAPAPASAGRLTTTEAATLAQNTETGTNPPVKTLTETQSVPQANTGNETEGRPGGAPGVGAKGEDGSTAANTKQIIAATQANQSAFAPRDNVLDQYASYTYNIGWYLLTPEQYTALQKTSKITISQYNLLIQSGGAPSTVEGVQPELTTGGAVAGVSQSAGRNPFFGLDYYFDNLEIKSVITGKGSNSAHNAAELSFTVTETAAITLIDNLWKAVKGAYKDSKIPYSAAIYALVIRFYGYDENGKIVQASDSDNKNAVVEKIIPFKLADIDFTVSNKLIEYHVKGVAVPYTVGFGTNLGVIKSNIEISGATVKDLLTKGVVVAEVSPADGRKPTPTPAKPAAPAAASTTTPQTLVITGEAGQDVGAGTLGDYVGA